ncbi:MAG: hypothetical protein ACI4OP_02910 [Candidatus Coprovivens sp.]
MKYEIYAGFLGAEYKGTYEFEYYDDAYNYARRIAQEEYTNLMSKQYDENMSSLIDYFVIEHEV